MLVSLDRCSIENVEIWAWSSANTIPLSVCTFPVMGRQMTCVSEASCALLVMSWFIIQ